MENKYNEEEMKKINEAVNNVKLQSPVRKINFRDDNKLAAGGMWLMTLRSIEDAFYGIIQDDGLENDTMLFFEPRHIAEVVQIIYGPLRLFEKNNFINKRMLLRALTEFLSFSGKFITYSDFRQELSKILNSTLRGVVSCPNTFLTDNFFYLLENIWFISYGDIDKICDMAIEEFRKRGTEDERNGEASGSDETSGKD